MNAQTARLLAEALRMRDRAALALQQALNTPDSDARDKAMTILATEYVHEDRIVNRIVSEDTDEELEL